MIDRVDFESPVEIKIDQKTLSDSHIRFVAEPWENGFGHTVGNALRRVLLSSMEGVAVTSIRIEDGALTYTEPKITPEQVEEFKQAPY